MEATADLACQKLPVNSLVSSIVQSFIVAIVTTAVSMVLCIPAAYSIARFKYRGRKLFMLSMPFSFSD